MRSRITPANPLRILSSVTVSTLESASSRMRIRGLRRIARAIAVRCFWPPGQRQAPFANDGSRPSGKAAISLARPAISAAFSISARVAFSTPQAMFSASVALNKNVSCGTKPIWRRNWCGIELPQIDAAERDGSFALGRSAARSG